MDSELLVLLAHPGGPLWGPKDSWTIPKGEVELGEQELFTARREFSEEVGFKLPNEPLLDLGTVRQSSTKINHIWAVEGNVELSDFSSNLFSMEWPPKTGIVQQFPECDRAAWFNIIEAKTKLYKTQIPFIDRLSQALLSKSC